MNYLFNLFNQIGAGPKNISNNLIKDLYNKKNCFFIVIVPKIEPFLYYKNKDNIRFIKIKYINFFIYKFIMRFVIDLVIIPIFAKKYQIKNLFFFGNFCLNFSNKFKKNLLIHHPYLIDNSLLRKSPIKVKIQENLKKIFFYFSLKNIDRLVVQSKYIKEQVLLNWHFKKDILIIGNPLSSSFKRITLKNLNLLNQNRILAKKKKLDLLYVSRFYPHKNHNFLINISTGLRNLNINHRIIVTINDNHPAASDFLHKAFKENANIENVGELPQNKLIKIYEQSHLIIYPSSSETFGNTILESMNYGLPIVVPDLKYSKSILSDSALFFNHDKIAECLNLISMLMFDDNFYLRSSLKSWNHTKHFDDNSNWVKKLLKSFKDK